jgi:antitoxin MazE
MQVSKWGNSLAVRLPKKLVDQLGLKEGDDIQITAASGRSLEVAVDDTRAAAIAALRALNLKLPEGYRFDREEANER